jgi:gluconolactonase
MFYKAMGFFQPLPQSKNMNMRSFPPHILLLLNTAAAAADLLATRCPTLPLENVACVNSYAAVLPLPFTRPSSLEKTYNPLDRFSDISVPDSSIQLVRDAPFTVYDEARAVKTLGPSPNLEIMFKVENVVHEAPVYVPELKAIIASQLHQNILSQIIIDLNSTPPTITGFEPSQTIYAVNGGRYFNGTVYWAVAGGSVILNSSTKIEQVPGIYTLDPITREVKPILNNYFGQRFNSPDDLVVDSTGDVFFTDPWYGSRQNLTQDAPVLHQQTYRFRPSTGAVSIVEASIGIPNGIALSPDERTLYISDTSVTNFTGVDPNVLPRYTWGATAGKSLYAFDTVDSPAGKYLVNKRPIWYPEEFAVDGLHVAGNGYLVGASGFGVDVLSQRGELLLRVQTDFIVNNVQFVEKDLWVFGQGKIARVEWNLEGLVGARS